MVVTLAPSACTASRVQLLTEAPSTWTTQAPHWLVSQPTWVPVSPKVSRRNWTNSVRGSTSPFTTLPFTVMLTVVAIVFAPSGLIGARIDCVTRAAPSLGAPATEWWNQFLAPEAAGQAAPHMGIVEVM